MGAARMTPNSRALAAAADSLLVEGLVGPRPNLCLAPIYLSQQSPDQSNASCLRANTNTVFGI